MRKFNEVVVTGVGVVSPLGSGDEFWENLVNGVSGVGKLTKFDTTNFRCHLGAEAKFDPLKFGLSSKNVRDLDSFSLYLQNACRLLIKFFSTLSAFTKSMNFESILLIILD